MTIISNANSQQAKFPIPFIENYKGVVLDPAKTELTEDQRDALKHNIQVTSDLEIETSPPRLTTIFPSAVARCHGSLYCQR